MAMRVSASTEYLSRVTSGLLDFNSAYTWMFWFQMVVDTAATSDLGGIYSTGTGDADYLRHSSARALTSRISVGAASTAVNGSTLAVGTWYHIAMVRASATSHLTYLNGVLDITNTRDITGRAAVTQVRLGRVTGTAVANARYAYHKAWQTNLSADQILLEMNVIRPVETAAYYWLPIWPNGSSEQGKDYSGNGRDFTVNGTIVDEDAPPVSYGVMARLVNRVSGTAYTQTVAGTLASAGEIIRKTGKPVAGTLTTAGSLVRKTLKVVAGTLTTAGGLVRKTLKVVAGTLTMAGDVATRKYHLYLQAVDGTLTSSGTLVLKTSKVLAGTLTSSGAIIRKTSKVLAGTLTTAGTLTRKTLKVLAGTLTMAGDLTRKTLKVLAGTLTSAGTLASEKLSPIVAAIALTLASRSAMTLAERVRAWTLAERETLTVPDRVRSWTLAIRNALTVRGRE